MDDIQKEPFLACWHKTASGGINRCYLSVAHHAWSLHIESHKESSQQSPEAAKLFLLPGCVYLSLLFINWEVRVNNLLPYSSSHWEEYNICSLVFYIYLTPLHCWDVLQHRAAPRIDELGQFSVFFTSSNWLAAITNRLSNHIQQQTRDSF